MGVMKMKLTNCSKGSRSWRTILALSLTFGCLAMTSGCSSVPDAVNPVSWYDSAVGNDDKSVTNDPATNELQAGRGTTPPNADDKVPSLSRVDAQLASRDNLSGGLSADVKGRKYADSIQRQGNDAQNSLYKDSEPPAAPQIQGQSAAPTKPVSEAPISQPMTPTPTLTPSAPTPVQSAASTAPDSSYGVDPNMANRLAGQLAEIRARAADQGSLLPSDLTSGGQGQPTIIVSSGGIETAQAPTMRYPLQSAGGNVRLSLANTNAASGAQVSNQGALPMPNGAKRVATIRFTNGSASLDTQDRKILSEVAQLQKNQNGTLRIIGHASQRTRNMDPVLHKMANFEVSMKRADEVVQELKRLGVAEDRILTAAVGDNAPEYLEVMPSGEAGNRRTEIYLSN